jgi:hypothetical protein
MSAIADTKDSFLDLTKLGAREIEVLKEFYNFLLFQKKSDAQDDNKKGVGKLPDVFYKPTKVKTYLAFERNEIYGKE